MSVVEFLKNVGALSVPDEVIKRAYGPKQKVPGRLNLAKLPNANVLMTFAPNQGEGLSRPLLAKDTAQAESALARTFGFSDTDARAKTAELQQKGQAAADVELDEDLASELVLGR